MTGLQPVAWAYELATTVTAEGYGCREVTEFENGRFVPVLPAGESP